MKAHITKLLSIILMISSIVFSKTDKNNNQISSNGIDPSVQFHNKTIFIGSEDESAFGMSTVSIGDFNGDGFEDFAVSAKQEKNSAGAVYIYFGGESFDNTPDVIFRGRNDYQSMGYSVSAAGDFNGDGFDDIIISSYNSTSSPSAYIYYGGPSYDIYEDVRLANENSQANFGFKLAKLGDVNGDGFDDIFVSDYDNKAYIYAGCETLDATADVEMKGLSGSQFGNSIAGGGDLNGDGFSDVIVGSTWDGTNGSYAGAAYVYLGRSTMLDGVSAFGYLSELKILGSKTSERFGSSVAIVKDINGDGFDEFAAAQDFPISLSGSNVDSRVFLYNGGLHLSDVPDQIYSGLGGYENFGYSITSLDFDGDGYSEVFAGAYYSSKVYAFSNKTTGAIWEGDVELSLEYGGSKIDGDFNGDGNNDLLTQAEGLYLSIGEMMNGTFTISEIHGDYVGDVNGDGYDDIIGNSTTERGLDIFWGNGNEEINNEIVMSFPDSLDFNVQTHGDFNGDGFEDFVIKSYAPNGFFDPVTDQKFYLFYGGRSISSTPDYDWRYSSSEVLSVSSGDVNGDSFDDLVISIKDTDSESYIYIMYGYPLGLQSYGSSFITSDMLNLEASLEVENSILGDFNNDGMDDIIITASSTIYHDYPYSDEVSYNYYLVWGNTSKDYSEFISFEYSDFIIGDYNGDEIDDVLTEDGILFGGNNFPNEKGPMFVAMYGQSSGDINGDGLDDVLFLVEGGTETNYYTISLASTVNSSPRIASVKDVPADQGGKVTLNWFKSGFDGTKVTSYQIERSIAPIGIGFAWEIIGNVKTADFNYYSFTAPTLNDETQENIGNTYFRVTALTDDSEVYYRSNIMYGNSVDNLAPNQVVGLAVDPMPEGVKVSWQLNTEEDFKEYKIYRSIEEEVNFDTLEVYGTSTDSIFVDETPLNESVYYFVRGTDIHENIGESASIYLSITGVNESEVLPTEFALLQNYPNPFNPTTTITFALPTQTNVKIVVYNSIGEEVSQLLNENISAGYHRVNFDATNLSSGMYFYRISAGDFVDVKKMMLLK